MSRVATTARDRNVQRVILIEGSANVAVLVLKTVVGLATDVESAIRAKFPLESVIVHIEPAAIAVRSPATLNRP